MVILVHFIQQAIGWLELLHFSVGDPRYEQRRWRLALIYLGSLYARLDGCVLNVTWSLRCYDVVSHMDSSFSQMFVWEHIEALERKPVGYSVIVPGETGKWSFQKKNAYWASALQEVDVK